MYPAQSVDLYHTNNRLLQHNTKTIFLELSEKTSIMSSTHNLNLSGILSETKRIISAHSRHFLALSVLFILPLSFSITIYPFLFIPQTSFPTNSNTYQQSLFIFLSKTQSLSENYKPHFLYAVLLLLLTLFATASVTYSTFHGFYGRPVKLVSSLKSIFYSVLPLVITYFVVQLMLVFGSFALMGVGYVMCNGILLLGVEIDYNSVYFAFFAGFLACLFVWLVIWIQIELCLVHVVVVVESKWGFEALRRSSYLVKGMKRVVFRMMLLFTILLCVLSMVCSSLVPRGDEISGGWLSWAFVFQTVVYVGFMTILVLYSVAANTVLFMYCKALHGELALEIAQEFLTEYVSLPFDDGKVPHVVYVM